MNRLNEYIAYILHEEGITGEVSPEENRRILLKYFNEYQFENQYEIDRFLTAFTGTTNIDKLNFIYDIYARIGNGLVMWIDDEGYYLPTLRPYHYLLEESEPYEQKKKFGLKFDDDNGKPIFLYPRSIDKEFDECIKVLKAMPKGKSPLDYIQEMEKVLDKNEKLRKQFRCGGCYSIKIEDKLVYIGKSTNILYRIANHLFYMFNLNYTKSNKYVVLSEAQNCHYKIDFEVIYKACDYNDEDEIGFKEGELIRKYMPPLNYQIPKEEDYHKFTINKSASTITLQQILGKDG